MPSLKKVSVLVAVLALSAIGAASASAAEFTYSATGTIKGKALEAQVFNTGSGKVSCTTAATTGTIASTGFTSQHVTVTYGGCTAFGLGGVHITPATYLFTANGEVHVESAITITSTLGGCTVKVNKQVLKSVDYANAGANNVKVTPTVAGIHSQGSGGLCGGTNTTGTYTGANEIEREGGGQLRFDP